MAVNAPVPPLKDLLAQLIRSYGAKTKKAFGDDVGLNGSTVSHLLSGDPHYVLGIESCLRIAHATGCEPGRLLRAAGKKDIAELLEKLYGKASPRKGITASADEQWFLRELRVLDEKTRRSLAVIVKDLSSRRSAEGSRRKRSSRAVSLLKDVVNR